MSLPDTGSLLEVDGGNLVVAICLGLLQVAFLNEFFYEEEKHARIAGEEIFDLV